MKQNIIPFIKTFFVAVFHTAFVLILIAVVLFAALFTRLQYAPVDVSFLEPSINRSFEENNLGLSLNFKSAKLIWSDFRYPLTVSLDDVVVLNTTNLEVAKIDEAMISLSFEALLFGRIRASRVVVEKPSFYIVRNQDGRFLIDFETPDKPPEEDIDIPSEAEELEKLEKQSFREMLEAFSSPKSVDRFFGRLDVFKINMAKLIYIDKKRRLFWHAPNLTVEFRKNITGFDGKFDTEIISKNLSTHIQGSFHHHFQSAIGEDALSESFVSLSVSDVNLEALIKDLGLEKENTKYSGTFTSNLRFSFLNDLSLTYVHFDTKLSNAEFMHERLLKKPYQFDKVGIIGNYDVQTALIKLDEVILNTPRVNIKSKAVWDISRTNDNISGELGFDKISVSTLKDIWFEGVAPNPREWVMDNLIYGYAKNGKLKVKAGMEYGVLESFDIDHVDGTFDFEDINIQYLEGFSPIEDGKGSATATLNDLVFHVDSGRVEDVVFGQSTARLYDFDKLYERITIKVNDIKGPARTIAKLIDNQPLGYISKIGQKPEHFSGDASGKIVLEFPLDKELKVEEVDFSGEISLSNFGLEKAALDKNLTATEMDLTVNTKELHAKGIGVFDGIPLPVLEWNEYFTEASKLSTEIKTGFSSNLEKIKDLGVDLSPYFKGEFSTDFLYRSFSDKGEKIILSADLTQTQIDFLKYINFKKEKRTPASAKVEVTMRQGIVQSVSVQSLSSSQIKLDAKGVVELDKEMNISRIDFPQVMAGKNDFSFLLEESAFEKISVKGKQIDLTKFFGNDDKQEIKSEEEKKKTDKKPRIINLDIEQSLMPESLIFKGFKFSLQEHKNTSIESLSLDAQTPNGIIRARYGLHPDTGINRLHVHSTNAGEALTGLGVSESLSGGEMFIKAISDEKSDASNTVKGQILIKDMTVIRAPTLARLLNAMSPTGFKEFFEGKGSLKFDRISSQLEWENAADKSILRLRDGKTRSASLGFTFDGNIDLEKDTVDFSGTIVPVRDINNFIAKIPILGTILTLGTGDAIFAATYRVRGDSHEPRVSVNPLSTLAPGFLRKLFFEQDFKDSDVQE